VAALSTVATTASTTGLRGRRGGGCGEARVLHPRGAEAPFRHRRRPDRGRDRRRREHVVDVEAIRGDLDDLKVEQHGRDIVIETRKKLRPRPGVRIRIDARTGRRRRERRLRATSGRGRLGELEVNTASGDVQVEDVDTTSRSARRAATCSSARSAAGRREHRVRRRPDRLGRAGGTIRSASGDVQIGDAAKRVTSRPPPATCTRLDRRGRGRRQVGLGRRLVGIRQGSRLNVDARSMSGDTTSEVELGAVEPLGDGPLVWVKAATMSGDIRIVRA
jgi:hypothetical protein